MNHEPYCAWCNLSGHVATQECRENYNKGSLASAIDKVAEAVAAEREACAQMLDECANDWNRIRDPGMANNARAYAKKIRDRASSVSRPNGETP